MVSLQRARSTSPAWDPIAVEGSPVVETVVVVRTTSRGRTPHPGLPDRTALPDPLPRLGPLIDTKQGDLAVCCEGTQDQDVTSEAGNAAGWEVDHSDDQPTDKLRGVRVGLCQLGRRLSLPHHPEIKTQPVGRLAGALERFSGQDAADPQVEELEVLDTGAAGLKNG
jgi:hypothetical protein